MSYHNLSALLEAIVYLAKEPVNVDAIKKALPDVDRKEIDAQIAALIEKYQQPQHGIEIPFPQRVVHTAPAEGRAPARSGT